MLVVYSDNEYILVCNSGKGEKDLLQKYDVEGLTRREYKEIVKIEVTPKVVCRG